MRANRTARVPLLLAVALAATACADSTMLTAPEDEGSRLTGAATLAIEAAAKPAPPPPPGPVYIVDFRLSSTKVPLGNDGTPYTVVIRNTTGTSQSLVFVQGYLTQNGVEYGAGGTNVTCGGGSGELPPGDCTVNWAVYANAPGLGTGQAIFRLELLRYDGVNTFLLDSRTTRVRIAKP